MPSNLFVLDSELPSFTGKETPQEQIRKMFNYLVQMKQSLQYALRNLTADNFNASALQTLTDGAKVEVSEQLTLMQTAISQMSGKLDTLSARISGLEPLSGQVTALEESDELLAAEIATLQEAVDALTLTVFGEGGILARLDAIEKKLAAIAVAEDGTMVIGAEGQTLRLVGQLYINGMAYGGDVT